MRMSMIVALAMGLAACASTGDGGTRAQLGSEANPVRVSMPEGERAYLSRLRCSDGAAPTFRRLGSGGDSRDGHILDIYEVLCANGEPRASNIWMDMYHPNNDETPAVPGFTLAPR